ncbi:hypothetical protein M422DRAFT_63430 [Sphaerobolus stellatus SS14]|nr:hypothetical protein M422DRAFT_63430 [Sphaerobolus stellatus SS14]
MKTVFKNHLSSQIPNEHVKNRPYGWIHNYFAKPGVLRGYSKSPSYKSKSPVDKSSELGGYNQLDYLRELAGRNMSTPIVRFYDGDQRKTSVKILERLEKLKKAGFKIDLRMLKVFPSIHMLQRAYRSEPIKWKDFFKPRALQQLSKPLLGSPKLELVEKSDFIWPIVIWKASNESSSKVDIAVGLQPATRLVSERIRELRLGCICSEL